MQSKNNGELDYIDGRRNGDLEDYHQESIESYSRLPQSTTNPVIEATSEHREQLKQNVERRKVLSNRGKKLVNKAKPKKTAPKPKRKYNVARPETLKYITNMYMADNKVSAKKLSELFKLTLSSAYKYLEKLRAGLPLEKKERNNPRVKIIGREGADLLYQAFTQQKVRSDKQVTRILNENGIKCSRQTVQRFVTDGGMEKDGYSSLTYKVVSYRGSNA